MPLWSGVCKASHSRLNDLSPCAEWRNSFQPNPQEAELEAPKAPHRHHHLLVSHGHTEKLLLI